VPPPPSNPTSIWLGTTDPQCFHMLALKFSALPQYQNRTPLFDILGSRSALEDLLEISNRNFVDLVIVFAPGSETIKSPQRGASIKLGQGGFWLAPKSNVTSSKFAALLFTLRLTLVSQIHLI